MAQLLHGSATTTQRTRIEFRDSEEPVAELARRYGVNPKTVAKWRHPGPFLLSPFVLAELDYLLAAKVGAQEQLALLAEVARGAFRLEPFTGADVGAALDTLERYKDLNLGIADASNAVLAARHATRDILTLDERHFRAVPTPDGMPFRLLPADL